MRPLAVRQREGYIRTTTGRARAIVLAEPDSPQPRGGLFFALVETRSGLVAGPGVRVGAGGRAPQTSAAN